MKNKLKYLIKFSLKKKFSNKTFKIINVILLLLIPALINIDQIIEYFGGDFDKPTNIYVIDNVGVYDSFDSIYNQAQTFSLEKSEVKLSETKQNKDKLIDDIKENKSKDIIIELNKDDTNIFKVNFYTYEYIDTFLYQNIVTALNSTKVNIALVQSNIDINKINNIYKAVEVERTILDEEIDENSEFMSILSNFLIPVIVIPFFFLIILVVQNIGAEINEEKTSRSMEIIISSVTPKTHFLSKIIATNLFVLAQGALFFAYSVVGLIIRTLVTKKGLIDSFGIDISDMLNTFMKSEMFNNILLSIPIILTILLLSFLAYSLLAGIIASMTTSMEDYQQLQSPIMIILLAGYYLGIIASVYDSAVFIKFVSYIPFISAFLSPVLLLVDQISIYDALISIVLLITTCLLLIRYGLKIYKVGILNYSSTKLWKKMFKAIKEK